jgi:Peptidase M1 N-terminal domain
LTDASSFVHNCLTAARDSQDGRLPLDLIPYHYNLDITPDFYLDAPPFPFEGIVSVSFECVQTTDVLTLNSRGLTITEVSVVISPDSPTNPPSPTVTGWTLEEAVDFLHISVSNPFEPGAKYTATITYNGIANSYQYGEGLYWDYYDSEVDGSRK